MYFMMTTALAVMASTLILRLHFRGFDCQSPKWMRFLVFDMLAPCLCLRSVAAWKRQHGECFPYEDDTTEGGAGNKNNNGDCLRQRFTSVPGDDGDVISDQNDVIADTVTSLGMGCSMLRADHISTEWKKISEVLDRLFFWIFMIFVMIPLVSLAGFVNVFKAPSA